MISNQILQNTIEGLKGISRVDFCVLDTEEKNWRLPLKADRTEVMLYFLLSNLPRTAR